MAKKIEAQGIPNNPHIKARSSDGNKVYTWCAFNDRPKCIVVSTDEGPEYTLNLKSLIAAMETNGYTITKKK